MPKEIEKGTCAHCGAECNIYPKFVKIDKVIGRQIFDGGPATDEIHVWNCCNPGCKKINAVGYSNLVFLEKVGSYFEYIKSADAAIELRKR